MGRDGLSSKAIASLEAKTEVQADEIDTLKERVSDLETEIENLQNEEVISDSKLRKAREELKTTKSKLDESETER